MPRSRQNRSMRATSSRHQSSRSAGCWCSSPMASRTRRTRAASPPRHPPRPRAAARRAPTSARSRARCGASRRAPRGGPARRAPGAARVSCRWRACGAASGRTAPAPRRPSPMPVGRTSWSSATRKTSRAASRPYRRRLDARHELRRLAGLGALAGLATPSSMSSPMPGSCASAVSRCSSDTGRSGRPVSASIAASRTAGSASTRDANAAPRSLQGAYSRATAARTGRCPAGTPRSAGPTPRRAAHRRRSAPARCAPAGYARSMRSSGARTPRPARPRRPRAGRASPGGRRGRPR